MSDDERKRMASLYVHGIHPVERVMETHPDLVVKILTTHRIENKKISDIVQRAKKRSISTVRLHPEKLDELVQTKKTQGIAALLSRFPYSPLDDLIAISRNRRFPLILMLDGITDPQNLGSIIRTASFFGVDGIIMPERNQAPISPTTIT